MRTLIAHLAESEFEERRILSEFSPLFEEGISLLVLRPEAEVRTSAHYTVLSPPKQLKSGALQKIAFEYAAANHFEILCVIEAGNTPSLAELRNNLASLPAGSSALYAARSSAHSRFFYRLGAWCVRSLHSLLLRKSLGDIHSAYRIYRVRDLERIPLDQNSDSRVFLIEITIQLLLAGKFIEERSSSVRTTPRPFNQLFQMALAIIGVSLKQRIQKLGLFYDSRFDLAQENEYYTAKFDFPSSHSFAVEALRPDERTLLLGSGPAELVRPFLKKSKAVVAIDQYAAPALREICVEAKDVDLNTVSRFESSVERFDKVFALDIIEHLVSPERFLTAIRTSPCTAQCRLILTTPNIAFFPIRLMLLCGQFNYGKRGILDRTHTRLFTFKSLRKLLEQQGFEVLEMKGVPAPFPLASGRNSFSNALLALNLSLIQIARGLFSFQIYVEAKPLPTAAQLLALSEGEAIRKQVFGQ